MKRPLIIILSAIFGLVQTLAYDFECNGIYYNYIGSSTSAITVSVTYMQYGNSNYSGDVVIPSNVTHAGKTYEVKEISNYAFYNCPDLTSVIIPPTVGIIKYAAFRDCRNLNSISIPGSVMEIDDASFINTPNVSTFTIADSRHPLTIKQFNGVSQGFLSECNITKLYIGRDINVDSRVKTGPFSNQANLSKLTIADHVTSIGDGMFSNNLSLSEVTLPSSLKTIGKAAFKGCLALTISEFPHNLISIGDEAFSGCQSLDILAIPSTITSIGKNAFSDCTTLKTLVIEDSNSKLTLDATTIPLNSLETLYLGRDLAYSFASLPNLKKVTLGSGVTTLPSNFCKQCNSLKDIDFGRSVQVIGTNAFQETAIISLSLPSSLTTISSGAFNKCTYLTDVVIEDSPTPLSMAGGQFVYCDALRTIHIGRTITYSYNANGDSWWKSPFSCRPNLENVTFSNYVTRLGDYFLLQAGKLRDLSIPSSVTYIGNNALGRISFNTLTFEDGYAPLATSYMAIGSDVDDEVTFENLYFGRNCKNNYFSNYEYSSNGSSYRSVIRAKNLTIGPYVTDIPIGLLSACDNIESLIIPGSVLYCHESLGDNNALRKIVFEQSSNPIQFSTSYSNPIPSLQEMEVYRDIIIPACDEYGNETGSDETTLPLHASNYPTTQFTTTSEDFLWKLFANSNGDVAAIKFLRDADTYYPIRFKGIENIQPIEIIPVKGFNDLFFADFSNPILLKSKSEKCFGCLNGKNISDEINSTEGYSVVLNPSLAFNNIAVSPLDESISADKMLAVHLSDQGELFDAVGIDRMANIEHLSISGKIGGQDFVFLNRMPGLKSLDLSDATIIGGIEYSAGSKVSDNTLAPGMLSGFPYLTKLALPRTLSCIKDNSFEKIPKVTSLKVPSSVQTVNEYAFNGIDNLDELIIEACPADLYVSWNSTLRLGSLSNLKHLYVGRQINSPVDIPTTLSSIEFSNHVTSIPDYSYTASSKIESLELPSSIQSLGRDAFSSFTVLKSLRCHSTTPPKIVSSNFAYVPAETCRLTVPKGALKNYWLDTRWSKFLNISDELVELDVIPDIIYGSEPKDLSQYSPAGVSLRYESSNHDIVRIEGTMLTIVGTGAVTIATTAIEDSYKLSGQIRTFNIVPAELEISVRPISLTIGESIPPLEFEYSGFAYSEDESVLIQKPTLSIPPDLTPGTYTIKPQGAKAKNYTVSYKPVAVTVNDNKHSIEWDLASHDFFVGDKLQLSAFSPSASNIQYSIDNLNIASLSSEDDKQFITLHRPGTVTVSASAVSSNGYSESDCITHQLTVSEKEQRATKITLNTQKINGFTGSRHRLVASIDPMNAQDAVEWSSQNSDIASVDQTGLVTIHSSGQTSIVASTCDGSGLYAECLVTANDISTSVCDTSKTPIEIYSGNGLITIRNLPLNSYLRIRTSDGQLIYKKMVDSENETIEVPDNAIYIVQVGDSTYKVMAH